MIVVVALDSASNILDSMLAFDADDAAKIKHAMMHSVDDVDTIRVMTLSELWQHECKMHAPYR